MAKYLERNSTTGRVTEVQAITTTAGAGDAAKIVQTDSNGLLDSSLLPSGITPDQHTANANGAITARDLVYIEAAGTIARAAATTSGNPAMGWATATTANGQPVTMQLEGRITGLSSLTVGARYYLSETPGALTPTPVTGSGKLHQYIGTALSATVLNFEPDDAVLLA